MRTLATLVILGALAMSAPAQHISADGAPQTFHAWSAEFLSDVYFHFSPSTGTYAGLHQYDSKLEDYSAAEVARQVDALHAWDKKLATLSPQALDASDAADYAILANYIRSSLLSLDEIRRWQSDPDTYSSGPTGSIFTLMSRDYAPVNQRLRSAVERERQIPQVLLEARKNLKNPPRIYTEIALQQIDGNISFFQNDVPTAFAAATDPQTKADFAKSNAAVISALTDYKKWMNDVLLPQSNGEFRLGADRFRRKLLYDEMVDTPLPRLLEIAYADLHKNQAEFNRIAHEIDPSKTPQQELAELAAMHPAPGHLLAAFAAQFDGEINFIRSHHIITIPSDVRPTLEETPPFMRATTQASMDAPGPFEKHSTTAYFNVTLPEKDWTPEHISEHMAAFNIGTIVSTSVHEAYPGHYIQFLYTPLFPSDIRRLFGASTNIEGWAHYCEQMMLDEGYGQPGVGAKDERESKLIRLGQLQDALLRDARFVVSIQLHTQGMSIADAEKFFVVEGYQSPSIASLEVKRGTSDATYLYYTLGKLQILKLRADWQKKMGPAYSIGAFHDQFMRQGFAPIKLVRKSLLGDDSPVL